MLEFRTDALRNFLDAVHHVFPESTRGATLEAHTASSRQQPCLKTDRWQVTERDFEWFEHKYPGWYDEFGIWWENYAKLSKPGNPPITFVDTGYVYPHRCWSNLV